MTLFLLGVLSPWLEFELKVGAAHRLCPPSLLLGQFLVGNEALEVMVVGVQNDL